jgi:hypothetical protein
VAATQRRQQPPPIATWRRSFTFFPDDVVRVAALSESVGRWVVVEAYARMLSGDAQFRVVLTM